MFLLRRCTNRIIRLFTCVIVGMFVMLGVMDTANTANNCTGATYYNATSDTCVACPTGYTDNTDAGKISINQCQMQCSAGTYLAEAATPAEAAATGLDGYTILEWLENTGTAYINTGVTHALETSKNIKGEFRIGTPTQVTANSNIIGTQSPTNNPKGYSVGWDKGFKIWIQNGSKKLTGPNHALSAGGIHDVEFRLTKDKKAYLKYDGSETNALSYGGVQSLNTIHLFEGGNHQADRYFIGRIYYLRIYEDDVLTHNFIPVRRNSDNALGVYDTEATSNNFAEATGTLVAGNALTIAPCSAVGAGQYAAAAMVNFGSASATPGTIAAGYFSTGGATTATPTANDCVGNNTCGKCTTDTTTGRTTYTDSAGGATSCSVCPELTGDLASRIISYDYYPSATHGNGIDGCRVNLSDTDPIATVSSGISCAYNATDNSYGGVNSSCQIAGTALSCPAGYPNISANQPEWDGTYLNFTSVDTMNGRLCETPGHTVTYDCGTGTGTAPASTNAVPGSPFTPAMNTCTKSGYVFAGWAVSGTNDVKAQGVAFTWDYGADKTFTAQWTEAGFAVTTTNLDANDTIKFNLSATGTFTVKCGTGGTLGGTGVSGTTITRNDTTPATYTCTYSTGGEKTIIFDGVATGYSTSNNVAAISFYLASGGTQAKIASVDGKLGVVFPTLGQNAGEQPQFYQTFRGCSNLGLISATPFYGVTGARTQMFKETFRECTSLTSLPTGLFGGVSGAAGEMFMDTFNGCTSLTSIPSGLFGNVSGAATNMFQSTFRNCTGLTSISVSLFSGVSGSASEMFRQTFDGCTSLASIPANLFGGVSGAANNLFNATFRDCSSLASIPSGLFNGISGSADLMFKLTFKNCSSLTSIPTGLFNGVSGAASEMFNETFSGCSKITSIPAGLFDGVYGAASNLFDGTFQSCSKITSIPADLFSGVTGAATIMFRNTFNGCSSLASIPTGLFNGVTGAAANLFDGTFSGCSKITSIPADLFSGVTGAATVMFRNTFNGCSSLTSIPSGLFSGVSGAAESLFNGTFQNCSKITSIPADLFSGVTGSANNEFKNTFNGCSLLAGYIPPSTFAGLIANGSPTLGGSNPMWTDTFKSTALATTCPADTTAYTTNYEGDTNGTTWYGKVSCTPTTTVAITLDAGTGNTASVPATVYLDYGTGWYSDSTGQTSITSLTTLPSKSGYAFGGFYTEPDGAGIRITDENGNFLTNDTALHAAVVPTTAYAHYGTGYTVTYSCGAGTGTAPTATTTVGRIPFTTAMNTCSREGYAFNGWAVSGTNDVKQPGDTFRWEYTENKTLTAQWAPFGVTTTNLNKGDTIKFKLSATGTFLVNCGVNGTLSGDGVSGNVITRSSTSSSTYTCTYISGGVKTLSFTGTATGYTTSDQVAAISFYVGGTQGNIASINGYLGTVFPTLGQNSGQQPQFYQTFYGTGITSIPATLFNGISGARNSMFRETFKNCTGITSIPATLFSGISGAAVDLFRSTFNGCSSLTSIPATLFNGISGAAQRLFYYTFEGCSSLASIPSTLFSGVSDSASAMFAGTFKSCTSITSIPEDLFSGVTGSENSEFEETFNSCTSLTGYIPPSTFAGLIANNHPTSSSMWSNTFNYTALDTLCPAGTTQYITGYEGSWNGKVSCFIPSTATITLNAGTGSTTVVPSSVYFKYAVGWYSDSGTQTSIASLTTLPTKTGYTFGGFYTSSDGTGTQVIDASGNFLTTEEVLRFTGNSTTVYAKWTPIEYTVTYSCGTGTGTPPTANTIAYDAQFTVATHTCTKSGEVFTGWAISDTNAVKQSTNVFTWNYTENKTLTAQWAPFAVTTTNLNANDTITFTLSAQGTFTVDCGDGGTLSSSVSGEIDGNIIKRGGTTPATYTCTYTTGGVKKIGFNGSATEYNISNTVSAISFYQNPGGTQARIAAIDGSLGAVFPTLGQKNGQQPRFDSTFMNTNITSIPATLFSGITGATDFMFAATFYGCPVTSIPSNLFSGITGGANSLFKGTFQYCTSLTSIPANLFSGITMANEAMFAMTFQDCTSLGGYIPPSTFSGLIANNHPVKSDMWNKTFDNTLVVTSCPVDTRQFTTGYEGSGTETWDGRVSCFVPTPMVITLDAGTDNVPSVPASVYLVFGDGWYSDSGAQTSIASLTTLPTKTGYTFGGYYTEQNGVGSQVVTAKGQFVTDNSVLIALTSASSVYAKWTPIEYSVTYSCGTGATGTTPTAATAVYDTQFTPATNTCFKSGSVFNGWSVSNTNDMQQPDTAFTWNYAENKTLTAQWTAFIVTTKSLSANSTFSFAISASGAFTVDCGTDGTLSGDGVSGNTITRNNTTSATYTCTYTTGGVKTIKFDGAATGYTTDTDGSFVLAAISFASSAGRISSIDGSLGAIFPTLGQNANQQPRFYRTFGNCNSLQSVPATLFTGVTGAIYGMFAFTFTMCTGMKSIPATLFSGITGNATALFYATFAGCHAMEAIPATLFSGITGHASALFFYTFQQCYKVTSIPETLFSGITGADDAMFHSTFRECSGLLSIPAGLFSGISGSYYEMFQETFYDCKKLVSIPATLFSGVSGRAERMFLGTFRGCSALTSIPATLFSGVTGAAEALFDSTFKNCTSLTTLPDTLFSGVSGAADKLFHETFSGCTSLASIPATLFSGVSGAASTMFNHVFYNCTSLASIPATLFSGVSGAADSMFDSAFSGCSGLTSIPATLFSGVRGAAGGMFAETFLGCSNITSIPEDLFSGVSGSAIWMFTGVFAGCGKVTSIPPRLFRGITGAAEGMMEGIFRGTSITSIPQGLFSGIYGSAAYLFQNTFRDCKSLTSIPDDLFSGITGSAANMFETTFYNCTSLSGYIPPATFAGLIENNHPVTDDMWLNTFNGTALYTSCPSGTIPYTTGYEGETNGTTWNGKVSCVNENLLCAAGEYLPANGYQCTLCPINSYCTGGTYSFNTQSAAGIASCASGLYAPVGMWESAQCGRILHIGDNVIYLRSTRQMNPSLNIDMDNDGTPDYFGNMTTSDVVMNSGTEHKLKISFGGQTYSVYDDTVTLPE